MAHEIVMICNLKCVFVSYLWHKKYNHIYLWHASGIASLQSHFLHQPPLSDLADINTQLHLIDTGGAFTNMD